MHPAQFHGFLRIQHKRSSIKNSFSWNHCNARANEFFELARSLSPGIGWVSELQTGDVFDGDSLHQVLRKNCVSQDSCAP
jgi:hypothetical protein